jgi:hypothetical protein
MEVSVPMSKEVAKEILRKGSEALTRESDTRSIELTGGFWNDYLCEILRCNGIEIDFKLVNTTDVAQMMSLLKIARSVARKGYNEDDYVDESGYAALAAQTHPQRWNTDSTLPEGAIQAAKERLDTPIKKTKDLPPGVLEHDALCSGESWCECQQFGLETVRALDIRPGQCDTCRDYMFALKDGILDDTILEGEHNHSLKLKEEDA